MNAINTIEGSAVRKPLRSSVCQVDLAGRYDGSAVFSADSPNHHINLLSKLDGSGVAGGNLTA